MTPFPAQWHHLAVQDSLHFPSYSRCSPPAHSFSPLSESFLPGQFSGFINILRQHSQCASASIFLSLPLSSSYFRCMPLPQCSSPSLAPLFFHPLTVFVADSSAPQEHWGEQRKQRFGSVALILIFCRLDGRLGGAFIHTAHNHFHCNCKPWLQTTGVVAISTNVPSVTRRLYVFYLKQWLVREHNVLSIGPRETDVKRRMGKKAQCNAHKPEVNITQENEKWINSGATSLCLLSLYLNGHNDSDF